MSRIFDNSSPINPKSSRTVSPIKSSTLDPNSKTFFSKPISNPKSRDPSTKIDHQILNARSHKGRIFGNKSTQYNFKERIFTQQDLRKQLSSHDTPKQHQFGRAVSVKTNRRGNYAKIFNVKTGKIQSIKAKPGRSILDSMVETKDKQKQRSKSKSKSKSKSRRPAFQDQTLNRSFKKIKRFDMNNTITKNLKRSRQLNNLFETVKNTTLKRVMRPGKVRTSLKTHPRKSRQQNKSLLPFKRKRDSKIFKRNSGIPKKRKKIRRKKIYRQKDPRPSTALANPMPKGKTSEPMLGFGANATGSRAEVQIARQTRIFSERQNQTVAREV